MIIKLTLTYILSRNTSLIENNTQRNIKKSNMTGISQFTQPWAVFKNDYNKINIFFQNIHKNNLLTNTILEAQRGFNIIFIQKPPWSIIWSIPSSSNKEEEELVGISNHPNWIKFSRNPSNSQDLLRVITYINIRLSTFCFC